MNQNKLLQRQIRKHLTPEQLADPGIMAFLQSVNESYYAYERDRELSNRAFRISEEEYVKINERLQQEVELRTSSIQHLKETIAEMEGTGTVPVGEDLMDVISYLKKEVNKRKVAEADLLTTANRLSGLIANMQTGLLAEDEHRNIILANERFCEFFGLPPHPEKLTGLNCSSFAEDYKHYFKDPELFVHRINKLVTEKKLHTGEIVETCSGLVLSRDYVPIFIEGNYHGHLWNYTDVTFQQRAREATLQSELKNRLMMNAALDAIITIDMEGIINFWNPQAEKTFGWTEEQAIGKRMSDLVIPIEYREQHKKGFREFFRSGQAPALNKIIELTALRRDGTIFPVELFIVPIVQDEETIFCSFLRDISERKKTEARLRENEERWQYALEGAGDGVWEYDNETREVFYSPVYKKILGYEDHEFSDSTEEWHSRIHAEDLFIIDKTEKAYDQGLIDHHEREYRMRHKDGHYVWIQDSGKVISWTEQNKPKRMLGTHRDITARKESEDQMIKLSMMARANKHAVLFSDREGNITWVNEGFTQLTGFTMEESLGQSPLQLFKGPLSNKASMRYVTENFYKTRPFDVDIIHYRKDGTHYWGNSKGQPYLDSNGKVLLYFTVIEDITLKKQQEEQLNILSRIAEDNINAVVIADANGEITWLNKSFVSMTGYTPEDVTGNPMTSLFSGPDTNRSTVEYFREQVIRGDSFQGEILNYKKDGTPIWQRVQGQPTRNMKGEITGYFALLEDITEEKETQKKLLISELRLSAALQRVGDNVWDHSFITGKTKFSETEAHLLGHEGNENEEMSVAWWKSIVPEDVPALQAIDESYRNGSRNNHSIEYRVKYKDGSIRWVLDRGVVIESDQYGLPVRIIGTHTDITKIKETEKALREEEERFRSLAENLPGVIYKYAYRLDGTEGFTYISPGAEKKIGVPESQLREFYSILHPDDRLRERELTQMSLISKNSFHFEGRIVLPDKPVIWLSISSSFSEQTEDETIYTTGIITNITKEKEAEHLIQQREEKYRNIIANMKLGLLEVDLQDRIQFTNQSFCEMSGYDEEELLGKTASQVFSEGENLELVEQKNAARAKGVADAYELGIKNKTGELRWWLVSGAPRYNDDGELVGSIGIHLDITEQKELENELMRAREEALQSSRTKELFLANMSHEIRTPMNAIIGLSRQLQRTDLSEKQHFFLDTINKAADHLLVIINDILDISKIEAGKMNLEKIGFRIRDVIDRSVNVMQHRAEEKGLTLSVRTDESLPSVLLGDPYRLNQILLNLVSNAIKFTESGYVRVSCEQVGEGVRKTSVRLRVSDSGIGMNEEFKASIFNKFLQEDSSISRKYGGSGLGLSIIRELVDLMHGEIEVESEKNKGTTISVTIPFEKGADQDVKEEVLQDTETSSVIRNKKILLVEDNEMNRLVVSTVLDNYGAILTEVVNGAEAVESLRNFKYDIVLMDMQMPVMNGLEATTEIRDHINRKIPIIALTANAIKGESEKCLAAGMNDFLSKPFTEEELISKLST